MWPLDAPRAARGQCCERRSPGSILVDPAAVPFANTHGPGPKKKLKARRFARLVEVQTRERGQVPILVSRTKTPAAEPASQNLQGVRRGEDMVKHILPVHGSSGSSRPKWRVFNVKKERDKIKFKEQPQVKEIPVEGSGASLFSIQQDTPSAERIAQTVRTPNQGTSSEACHDRDDSRKIAKASCDLLAMSEKFLAKNSHWESRPSMPVPPPQLASELSQDSAWFPIQSPSGHRKQPGGVLKTTQMSATSFLTVLDDWFQRKGFVLVPGVVRRKPAI